MGKKLKGGRRQILQLEEKKPPKSPTKTKYKSLIHYSDSDDDSKKSNDSEPPSIVQAQKDAAPLDTEIADFFKEIDALSVPEELLEPARSSPAEEPEKSAKSEKVVTVESKQDVTETPEAHSHDKEQAEEVQCAWQEICDDSTGYSYYWNMHTNEVTWDCPEEYANYIRSLNSAAEDKRHNSKETNIDVKKAKRKKESPQLPEGAIIPISYFGNSSSDNSSDSETEPRQIPKKQKINEKPTTSKRKKTSKKQTSKPETEIFGPQLPPDFQFPMISEEKQATKEDSFLEKKKTKDKKAVKDRVEMGPFLPENFVEEVNDVKDSPAETEISLGDIVKDICESSKKSEDVVEQIASNKPIQGYRPVVDYDSFTDEEEDIPDKVTPHQSSEPITEDTKTSLDIQKDIIPPTTQPSIESETTPNNSIKSSETKVKLRELILKIQDKDLKRKDVDIDSLFAAHSSYGKRGFGFGFRDQEDDDYKRKNSKKAVSFVKSDLVLNLGSLNDIGDDEESHLDEDTNADEMPSVAEEQPNEVMLEEKVVEEESSSSEEGEIKSPKIVPLEGGEDVEEEESVNKDVLEREVEDKVVEQSPSSESSFELTDDLDEIDKALCEALYKKKAQIKSKPPLDASTTVSTEDLQKDIESSKAENCEKESKTEEIKTDLKEDTELKTRILDTASILIDKLTFLLSNSTTTMPSLNSLLIQLQTRLVDWQASALDSPYFSTRLQEVSDYLLHYETGVVSGDWTCQWDRYGHLSYNCLLHAINQSDNVCQSNNDCCRIFLQSVKQFFFYFYK